MFIVISLPCHCPFLSVKRYWYWLPPHIPVWPTLSSYQATYVLFHCNGYICIISQKPFFIDLSLRRKSCRKNWLLRPKNAHNWVYVFLIASSLAKEDLAHILEHLQLSAVQIEFCNFYRQLRKRFFEKLFWGFGKVSKNISTGFIWRPWIGAILASSETPTNTYHH